MIGVIEISCVYKITNDVNNKVYIGVTRFSLRKRWNEHLSDARRDDRCNRPLYKAINKYGAEKFHISIIEKCNDDVLFEREKFWIEKYGSYLDGYNATYGGQGKQCVDYDIIIHTYMRCNQVNETAKILGVDPYTVRKALRENGIKITSSSDTFVKKHGLKVKMFSMDGQFIKAFPSSHHAARYVLDGKNVKSYDSAAHHIADVCRGIRNSAYNHKWCFA